MNYTRIVQDVIEEHKAAPVDLLGIGNAADEYAYLNDHLGSYARTVRDIDNLFNGDRAGRNILEIGSFLGTASVSLKKMGYRMHALDIPEYHQSAALKSLYERNGIPFEGSNLRRAKLPYESNSLDAVIICEVMEHLNFNPLPVLKEINRVLKNGGYVYIAMPNQAYIGNRLKLILGKSIHNPIRHFFLQLDRKFNVIVGLHWREYTLTETVEMVEKMGFSAVRQYYPLEPGCAVKGRLKASLKKLAYLYPPFRPAQVVIGQKVASPDYDFWLTEANS